MEGLAVEDEFEARIEVAVMAQAPLDDSGRNCDSLKISGSGTKRMQRAVGFLGVLPFFSFLSLPCLEGGLDKFAFAIAAHQEILGEGVDRFGADAVKADAELEDVIVVFGAGVDFRNAIHDFAQRNAAAKIAHGDGFVLDVIWTSLPSPMMNSSMALSMTSFRRM